MLVCFLLQVEPQFFRRNKFQPPLSVGSAIKQNSKLEFFEVQPNSSKHIETLQAVFINVSFQSISGYRPRFNTRPKSKDFCWNPGIMQGLKQFDIHKFPHFKSLQFCLKLSDPVRL
jgi:hypothetical protein